jgi:hypothetical protein
LFVENFTNNDNTTTPMKMTKIFVLAALCCIASIAASAQEGPQGGPQRDGRGSRRFQPTLNGTWQLCTLTPGEDNQPQLSLLPILKVIDQELGFQNIGIPSEGACFIQKQGRIEKLSDTTYVEHRLAMRFDSTMNDSTVYRFRLEGPMWLMIDYMEAGKETPTSQLWLRVQPQRQRGPGGEGQQSGMRPEPGKGGPGQGGPNMGKRPSRRPGSSNQGNTDSKSSTGNFNPFANDESSNSDDFDQ